MRILYLCSVENELAGLVDERFQTIEVGKKRFYYLRQGHCCSIYGTTGVGKANAAIGATIGVLLFRPALIMNFGIGGGFPQAGVQLQQLLLATEEYYADEGVLTGRGFSDLSSIGLTVLQGQNNPGRFITNKRYTKKVLGLLKKEGMPVRTGPFITVSTITGTDQRARYLYRRFGAICESMEGAAVAHVARAFGVDFVELRTVSNMVGKRQRHKWRVQEAVARLTKAIALLSHRLF